MRGLHWIKKPAFRFSFYAVVTVLLIAYGIFQIYDLYTQLRTDTGTQTEADTEIDEDSTLLEPYAIYWTLDGERFGMLNELSGYYSACWSVTEALLTDLAEAQLSAEEIDEEDLPSREAVMVLMYEAPLESTALSEYLSLEIADISVSEIRIVPADGRTQTVTIYLMDWDQKIFYTAEAQPDPDTSEAYNEVFYNLSDEMDADAVDARQSFPTLFERTVFIQESGTQLLCYIPEISISYLSDDGTLTDAAVNYCMHFFTHPDVVSSLSEDDETNLWYADEKRTVRYDTSGLLQYVATLEPSETEALSLHDAYQLAAGFLQSDLAEDDNLLQEVYLASYTVEEDGVYTFVWNYCYRHIPFVMSEETADETGLEGPIVITVEGSRIRYYHRYLLTLSMAAEETAVVSDTATEAIDQLFEDGETSLIQDIRLVYAETAEGLDLKWSFLTETSALLMESQEVRG